MQKPETRLSAPLALNVPHAARRASSGGITRQLRASTALRLLFRATAWTGVSISIISSATANPTGGKVVQGQATINQSDPNATVITQTTQNATINWNSFGIDAGQRTSIYVPNKSAVEVERVTGGDPSKISGLLESRVGTPGAPGAYGGTIVLINPNGIVFSGGSQVNVGGLIASTADLAANLRDNDPVQRLNFNKPSPNPNATIVNQGTITVADHGLAALVAPGVQNSGVITAKFGKVMLAGAQTFTVDLYGDGLLSFDVTSKIKGAIAINDGQINAPGGVIQLSASAIDDVVAGVINIDGKPVVNGVYVGGTVSADAQGAAGGTIIADAGSGHLSVSGQISASGVNPGETGGSIALTGNSVEVQSGATIDASGSTGGGSIKVGGGFHGTDTSIRNAKTTTIAAGATLDASALDKGNGGSVVVWSDQKTDFAGTIVAKGGAQGGDGGKAEVSSKDVLNFTGFADLRAPFGKAGTLLLDPLELDICATTCTATTGDTQSDLSVSMLLAELGSGTNVQLSADVIDFQSSIPYTGATAASLSATATQSITLESNVSISSTAAPLAVNLNAGPTGSVTFDSGSSILTDGGQLSVAAGTGGLSFADNTVQLNTTGTLSDGNLSLSAPSLLLTGTINAGAATLSLTASAGDITENAATVTAGTLTGSSGGSLTLAGAGGSTNSIGDLNTFTVGTSGNFSLADATALTIDGTVTVPGTFTLNVNGTISETGAGTINAGTLTGSSVGTADLTATNTIADLNTFTVNGSGDLAINDLGQTGTLTIDGTVAVPGTFNVAAGGTISETGSINAATLKGRSAGTATLSGTNTIADLNTFTVTSGNLVLNDLGETGTLTIDGAVTVPGTFTLNAGGTISETGAGTINAGTLTGSSVGTANLTTTNTIADLNTFTVNGSGDLVINDLGQTGTLTIDGTVTVPGTFNIAAGGTISENPGGTINAATLKGRSVGTTSLGQTNTIADLNTFTVTSGNLVLNDLGETGALTIDGTVTALGAFNVQSGGAITEAGDGVLNVGTLSGSSVGATSLGNSNTVADLSTFSVGSDLALNDIGETGTLTINGTVTAPGTFNVQSGGAISEASGGILNVGTLTGSSAGATSLGNSNTVADLSTFSVGSDLALNDLGETGTLTINGTVTAPGTFNVQSGGAISEAGGGILNVGTLTGSSAGATSLGNSNTVADLSTFSVGSDLALNDLGETGTLTINGTVTAPGTFNVQSGGAITEAGGGILNVGTLTGSSAGATNLGNSNTVADLNTFSVTTGNLVLADTASLTIDGAVTASNGNIALTDGGTSLSITGTVTSSGTTTITAAGESLGVGGGTGTLQVSDGSLGQITAGGGVILATQAGSDIGVGTVTAHAGFNELTFNSGNDIDLTGSVAVTGPGTLRLIAAGSITENAGATINVSTLSGSSGGSTTLAGINTIADLSTFSVGSDFALNDLGEPGTLTINGIVTAPGTFNVQSGGAITEAGGGILNVGTLTGSSAGATSLGNSNTVADLSTFSVGSDLALNDLGETGTLTINGTVTAPGTFNVQSGGAISEAGGGILNVGTLTGSSVGATSLGNSNTVADLSTFSVGSDLALNDLGETGTLTINGTVTAPGTFNVQSGGAISEAGGGILNVGTLTGSSAGATSLGNSNTVADLSTFSVGSDLALNDLGETGTLTINGTVTAPGTFNVQSGGAITEAGGGILNVGTLTGSSAGATSLGNSNTVADLNTFSVTTGNLVLADTASLTIDGAVTASNGNIALTDGGTSLSITGTVTSSGTTTITAAGESLGVGGGTGTLQVSDGSLGQITAGGGVILATQAGSDIGVGTVTAHAGFNELTFNSGNDIDLTGSVAVTGPGTLRLIAAGSITENAGATINVSTLSGSSGGSTTLAGINTIADLSTFSVGSDFALNDLGEPGTLTINGIVTAPGTFNVQSGGAITEAGGGILNVGTLTGSSAGATSLGNSNTVADLSTFSVGSDLALNDLGETGTLTINGTVTAPGTFNVQSGGAISEAGGGILNVGTLTGSSAGGTTLGDANLVTNLDTFTNNGAGGFSLTDAETLSVVGPVNAGTNDLTLDVTGNLGLAANLTAGGTVALDATGTVSQTSGIISANSLTGTSTGGTTLGDANLVANLGTFTNSGAGGFSLTDAETLSVVGPVNAGTNALTLDVTGNLGVAADLTAGTTATLTVSGNISQTGGTISGTSVALDAGGTIRQTGGTISTATLTGTSTGGTTLGDANLVANLGTFTNSGAGGFSLTDAETLSVVGPVNAGTNDLTLDVTGNLGLAANLTAGGTVALDATGTVSQTSGIISANSLTGTSTGGTTLGDANRITDLGTFTNSGAGGFSLTDAETLSVVGPVNAGTTALTLDVTGNLGVAADLTAGTTATLTVSGNISQTGGTISGTSVALDAGGTISQTGGTISTATLTGTSTGGTTLGDANLVANLGTFTNSGAGGFSLTDAETLSVVGPVNAGTTALTLDVTGNLGVAADLTAGTTATLTVSGNISQTGGTISGTSVALDAGGTISQTGGTISTATLTGTSTGGTTLGDANLVANLGTFTNSGAGGLSLTDAETLSVVGPVNAGTNDLTLDVTGNLGLAANLTAGGTVALDATGTVSQTSGIISANSLTGTSTGGTTLGDANRITDLGTFTNSGAGGFSLTDAETLSVVGPVNAGTTALTLDVTGNLGVAADLTAGTTATLTVSGNISQTGGTISGTSVALDAGGTISQTGGTISTATLTGTSTGGTTLGDANLVANLGTFTNNGAGGFSLTDAETLSVVGPVNAGATALTLDVTGNLGLAANLTAGGTVALDATGTVSQTSGIISANSLTGTSTGGTTLGDANLVANLGTFTNSGAGGFSLTDAETLSVVGPVNAGTNDLTLDVTGNLGVAADLTAGTTATLTVSGNISQTGGTISGTSVALDAGGIISQTGGTISTATLTGTSTGGTTLGDANLVANLGTFTNSGAGGFSLTDAETLSVVGPVNAGTTALTLDVTGNLGVAADLTAGTTATLTVSGNISQTGGTISGTSVALDAGGTISQTGGTISTATLTGTSTGGTTLGDANLVANLGTFTNSGAGGFSLTDAETLSVVGPVNAGTTALTLDVTGNLGVAADLTAGTTATLTVSGNISQTGGTISGTSVALDAGGTISQTGGTISTATLTGTSTGGTTLGDANLVANLGTFTNSGAGGFSLTDAETLSVVGPVNAGTTALTLDVTGNLGVAADLTAGTTATLTVSGNISQTGGTISGTSVALDAGGTISQTGGTISTATLTGTSTGGTTLGDANLVANLGTFTNSGAGGFSLTDAETLSVVGPVNAGTTALTLDVTGNLGVAADLAAGTTATLTVSGNISQTGGTISGTSVALDAGGTISQTGGTISTATLTGTSTGGTTLGDANLVANLGTFTNNGAGGFALTDAETLSVVGPVNAGTTALTLDVTGNLGVAADLTAGTTATLTVSGNISQTGGTISGTSVALDAGGTISQTGGTISTATLTGTSTGGTSLADANRITDLGTFTNSTSGGFALTDAETLHVVGTVNAGPGALALNVTGDLDVAANLSAGTTATLTISGAINQTVGTISATDVAIDAGGDISQSGGATITAATLTGTSTGGTSLNDANQIADLGAFINSGGGNFSLTDARALSVNGTVNAGTGNLSLNISGPLTLSSNLDAGGTVALIVAGAISQTGGVITAADLTGSSVGGANLGGANAFAASTGFSNTGGGAVLLNDNTGLTLSGAFSNAGGSLTITALGDIASQNISLTADTAAIRSAGSVALNGGTFNVTDRIFIGSTTGITETGTASFATPLVIFDATGAPISAAAGVNPTSGASLVTTYVPGADSANIQLSSILAPNSSVLLAANHGHITIADINTRVLGVVGQFGSAQMFGEIGGIAGPTAAQNVGKSGERDNNYRFNNCAIGSLTCIVLPEIVPITPQPVETITVLRQQQFNDPTINLLNVGDEDLVLTSEATTDSEKAQ